MTQNRTVAPSVVVTAVHAGEAVIPLSFCISPGHEPSALHQYVHVPTLLMPRQAVWGPHDNAGVSGLHELPAGRDPAGWQAYVCPSCVQQVWSAAQS